MLCAAKSAERGLDTILLDPNSVLGRKVRITGKGRCNLSNDCDIQTFMKNVPRNARFLYSSLARFSPQDTKAFFEGLGVPVKTERGNRMFPVSDKAADISDALEKYMRSSGARVLHLRAKSIITENGAVAGVNTNNGVIQCRAAVICTGGASYPGTGSTGDGYRMAAALGHSVIPAHPSLVPLESDDPWCAQMQGFAPRNVLLTAFDGRGRKVYEEFGEMLFTHFGVSGPLVLSASAHMRDFENEKYRLSIDLKPALDEQKLDERVLRDFAKYANRDFSNALGDLAGRAMIPVLIQLSGIPGDTKVNSITKQQRRDLVALFKAFPVSVSGPRPIDEAIVTSGGVDVREVNPRTMESKLVDGLYFAGEVLDVDAYTGGFNLQIAWSTGITAGTSVLQE